MKNKYLGLKASKQLIEWGCKIKSEYVYFRNSAHADLPDRWFLRKRIDWEVMFKGNIIIPTYSYYDIIITHAKEFFGEEHIDSGDCSMRGNPLLRKADQVHGEIILAYLRQDKQKEADQYILDNCIFNPKNK